MLLVSVVIAAKDGTKDGFRDRLALAYRIHPLMEGFVSQAELAENLSYCARSAGDVVFGIVRVLDRQPIMLFLSSINAIAILETVNHLFYQHTGIQLTFRLISGGSMTILSRARLNLLP